MTLRLLRRAVAGLLLLLLLAMGASLAVWFWPRSAAVLEPLALPPASPDAGGLQLSWWGVSAVLIEDGEHALFIDPFFSRPEGVLPLLLNRRIAPHRGRIQAGLDAAGLQRLDAVLVSHSHYDHAMDVGVLAQRTGAVLLGSESTLQIGRGAGMAPGALRLAEPGVAHTFGPFRVTFLRSRHAGATGGHPTGEIEAPLVPPARYLDYRQGGTWSILIEHPQGNLLHHGSAGFEPDALRAVRADVVIMGVAVIDDLQTYLAHTVDLVGADSVIPVHWDDFLRPLDQPLRPMPLVVDLPAFVAEMQRLRPGLQVQALPLGQRTRWPPAAPTPLPSTRDNPPTHAPASSSR